LSLSAVEIIIKKREKGELSKSEIDWLISNYTNNQISDEQMSSMAMAILLNGMSREEIKHLTQAMIDSGERMDFSELSKPTADKHSTGGVGDKITLPLAPLVASYGVAVPQLSGRGLGHTGGTLDKLEAIPGWQANLSNQQMFDQLEKVGAVVCAAGSGLAPADKKLYALRDVTGTVEAIPLIASSIMSKKIAEGTASLVLDVKVGSGAFMKNIESAQKLAETLVSLGKDSGVKTSAFLTDMSTPLGRKIGNALEVEESIEVLAGGGPADVVELTLKIAQEMLALSGVEADPAENLKNGKAMDKWREMISAQSGDLSAPMAKAKNSEKVYASKDGFLELDALGVGMASWRLGAGREKQGDKVQDAAGVVLHKTQGDEVKSGDLLAELFTDSAEKMEGSKLDMENAANIVQHSERKPIVLRELR
jgi:thymidine phosphorylase